MVELILKDTIVNLYTSIKELPITKYQDFCKLAMIDYGVGSDMAAYNAHFTKLHNLLMLNKNSDAINEMKNIHNNYFYVINNIGAWSFCFAPFIATINGKEYTYELMEDHKKTINDLSKKGLTVGMCEETIDDIKKKLTTNLNYTFLSGLVVQDQITNFLSSIEGIN